MALKVIHNHRGHRFKMGRKRASRAFPGHHLKRYLDRGAKLPSPPPAPLSYGEAAAAALAKMYGNDQLGDCVIAGMFHDEGVVSANAGDTVLFSDTNVTTAYGWCGYNPSDPTTDQGCEIQPVIENWISLGLPGGGSKAVGYLAVDPTNVTEIQTALYLFENLIFGVELPDGWVNPMPNASGFTWDVAGNADPNNGHCFIGFGYSDAGVDICTWAMTGTVTYKAMAQYCSSSNNGELYVVITQDILNKASQKSPDGLDWATLVGDFDAMGGNVTPPPAPTPSPSPSPTPTPAPSPTPTPTPAPTPAPTPTPSPTPAPNPSPTPGGYSMVPLPAGAYGIVVPAHGNHPPSIHPLPRGAAGIAVED